MLVGLLLEFETALASTHTEINNGNLLLGLRCNLLVSRGELAQDGSLFACTFAMRLLFKEQMVVSKCSHE